MRQIGQLKGHSSIVYVKRSLNVYETLHIIYHLTASLSHEHVISKNYKQNHYWWLVDSHLNGCFCLSAPKFWEGGGDLQMILCQSVSAVCIFNTLIGGGDTQTLTTTIKCIFNLLYSGVELLKHCSHIPTSHLVKLSLPSI